MSPSFVSRMRPSESLSSRPTGKIRSGWPVDVALGRRGDAARLVEREIDRALLRRQRLAVDLHDVAGLHLRAELPFRAVDGHAPGRNPGIRLAPARNPTLADVLVEPHRAESVPTDFEKVVAPCWCLH
jgi:hypothetical protein